MERYTIPLGYQRAYIVVQVVDGTGVISNDLRDTGDSSVFSARLDGLEAVILAHACAGIDVSTPMYIQGVQDALEAILNNEDDDDT